MALSDRIRPDVEAAPWVIEEVKKLENDLAEIKKFADCLVYLMEDNYTVVTGLRSCWIAEIDGTSRVGQKHNTIQEAIDDFMRNNP